VAEAVLEQFPWLDDGLIEWIRLGSILAFFTFRVSSAYTPSRLVRVTSTSTATGRCVPEAGLTPVSNE